MNILYALICSSFFVLASQASIVDRLNLVKDDIEAVRNNFENSELTVNLKCGKGCGCCEGGCNANGR